MTEKKTSEKTTEEKKQSVYERLSKINVKPYLKEITKTYKDKRTGQMKSFKLDYLSWAQAWGLVKAIYPDADYKIREYPNWVKTSDGTFQQAGTLDYRITSVGCEVEVTAIIEGVNYTQKLYPMNAKNEPIPNPSIKDINKAQMRCLVKALALAGLGLEVYAGEDLPSNEDETAKKPEKKPDKVTPINRSKSRNTAKPNFKTLTEAQLKNYTVKYQEEKDKDPIDLKVSAIYTLALQGNQSARKWFEEMKTKLNTEEGQAVAQFRSSRYAAEIRQAMKSKEEVKEA